MLTKVYHYVKNFFAPETYYLMVINGRCYRPMASLKENKAFRDLSKEQYMKICERINQA